MNKLDLNHLNKKELNKLAKENGLKGYSQKNREELIEYLQDYLSKEEKNLTATSIKTTTLIESTNSDNKFTNAEEKKIEKIVQDSVKIAKKNNSFIEDITLELEINREFGIKYDKSIFLRIKMSLEEKGIIINYNDADLENEILKLSEDTDVEEQINTDYNINNLLKGIEKKQNNDLVKQYLNSINDYPLLSKEMEKKYGKIISDYKKNDNPTEQEERDFQEAKDMLSLSNKRLVVSVAKKYINRGLDLIDLIHEGTIGLLRAVDKYDYETGFKFSTYATWWVRQGITRAIADKSRVIRIPVHMVETINKVTKTQRELLQKNGYVPSNKEIAENMVPEMTEAQIDEIFKIARDPVSLEIPVGDDNSSLESFVEDSRSVNQEEASEKKEFKKKLISIIEELPEREGEVIKYRYGLYELNEPKIQKKIDELTNLYEEFHEEKISVEELVGKIQELKNFNPKQKNKYVKRVSQSVEKYVYREASYNRILEKKDPKSKERLDKLKLNMQQTKTTIEKYILTNLDLYKEELEVTRRIDEMTGGIVKNLTLEEVGILFNVTRERIRQIESKGRRKLKSYAVKEKLDLYL